MKNTDYDPGEETTDVEHLVMMKRALLRLFRHSCPRMGVCPGACTTNQDQHALDYFQLPGYTKRNNHIHDKWYHNGGYQLSNSTQILPI